MSTVSMYPSNIMSENLTHLEKTVFGGKKIYKMEKIKVGI